MLGQDQVDPGPDQPHLNPLFMVPNVPKTFMDVEPLIKVQENHVRRKPPLGARHHLQPIRVESLSQRLAKLSLPRVEGDDSPPENIVDIIPPEVLMKIFSYLDDISLFAVGNVCRRWYQLLQSQTTPEQWFVYTRRRWPLFNPMIYITDWFATYSALIESTFCLTCIYQMAEDIPDDIAPLALRQKRLGHDLRGLLSDASEGIRAKPLDSSYYHWQATITGPVGSPYEGGIFFLYLKVPFSFPFNPPEVRFLTRIFHPNVSRHGDIGIDSIQQHNLVSGLTIPKVLISIQSLLTDPYTEVCMEPDIGRLYKTQRSMFDAVARIWTWKYAMWDTLAAKSKSLIILLPLRFYVKSNFGEFIRSKNVVLGNFRGSE